MEVYDISLSGRFIRTTGIKVPKMIVYAWRRKDEYLYVGKSKNGLERFKYHNIANKIDSVRDTDYVDIWICANEFVLGDLENNLIWLLKPKYNTAAKAENSGASYLSRKLGMSSEQLKDLIDAAREKE